MCAVRNRIGTCRVRRRCLMSSASSRPFMPGILMSRTIAAKSWSSSASSASSADCARTSRQPRLREQRLDRLEVARLVVDDEDLDASGSLDDRPAAGGRAYLSEACWGKRSWRLHRYSQTRKQRQQLVGVDRLGDVVRRAGLQALLAVALHGLGRQRENRQRPEPRRRGGSRASSRSRPSPAS